MKRVIRASSYVDYTLKDKIVIDVDVPFKEELMSSTILASLDPFPGEDDFREDVVKILENEFGFEVIEEVHDGKRQKGYCSNREDSISIYFNTYFDFEKANDKITEPGVPKIDFPEGTEMFCFIHIRFSDHTLADEGYTEHQKFIRENAKKHSSANPKVTHYIEEGEVEVEEDFIYWYYNKAIDLLRTAIQSKLPYWAKVAKVYKEVDE